MMPVLYPFQLDLFNRVRAALIKGARIVVVQGATGCGKNTWAAYVCQKAVEKNGRVLFMVHRRKLVDQISERLKLFDVDHSILMRGEQFGQGAPVVVASRDTLLSRCFRNEWVGLPFASLIIVDECHHAAADDSEYKRILAQYPKAIILLLSATPVGPDGKGLGPWAQAIECAAPTSQLVRDGYLMPVKVFAPERKKRGNRYLRGIAGDLVESWKQYAEDRPTVLFSSRVQHSLDAVAAFKAAGVTAAHLDADTPDDRREEVFDAVAGGRIKILSNVGIVGEGVDVPELSCCQLFCEVNSRVRFLQAVGRVMRPAPGKTHGILIDHSGAVFNHGFPDEDSEWTLEGNVDENYKKKHDAGDTPQAHYCKHCEIVYKDHLACPECGRMPSKPPRSIFASLPDPVDASDELLVAADRNGDGHGAWARDQQIKHWFLCLTVAANKGGNFKMASAIWKNKYHDWPPNDFPCMPGWRDMDKKVTELYPKFSRRKAKA